MPPEAVTLTDLVPIPSSTNIGVTSAKQSTMLGLLGNPRSNYTSECQAIEHPELKKLVTSKDLGVFKVRGLQPAVESIERVMADIRIEAPQVHAALGTMGMLCARLVRGSQHAISNHSWGTAIDVTLNGVLDRRGDGKVQAGLVAIAPIINRHGWFWGATFATEDAMHFEVGDGLIRQWHKEGRFGRSAPASAPEDELLSIGDRGPEVTRLQQRLNALGAQLTPDGDVGIGTRAALIAFQVAKGLTADGVAGKATRAALGV
jgi:hypothetical protein